MHAKYLEKKSVWKNAYSENTRFQITFVPK